MGRIPDPSPLGSYPVLLPEGVVDDSWMAPSSEAVVESIIPPGGAEFIWSSDLEGGGSWAWGGAASMVDCLLFYECFLRWRFAGVFGVNFSCVVLEI